MAFGRGGGLSIYIKGDSYNNTFEIADCSFTQNNAIWGGGMLAEFQDYVAHNTLNIMNSLFISNECHYTPTSATGGGGLRLGHWVNHQSKYPVLGNIINVDRCHFADNRALNGGGLSILVARQNTSRDKLVQINVNDCVYSHNIAHLGSAVYIDTYFSLLGLLADVHMARPSIEYNIADYVKPNNKTLPHQAGLGAVCVHEVFLMFHESAAFLKNDGSALAAIHTQLYFSDCNANFYGNSGHKGGAVILLGGSFLIINETTQMNFQTNNAMVQGGAIYNTYIVREHVVSTSHCFFQHINRLKEPEDWGARFTFQGNTLTFGSYENSIYSTSILPCTWAGTSIHKNKSAVFCWEGWYYTNSTGDPVQCSTQLSTDVGEITLTAAGDSNLVQAFPGHEFKFNIDIKDDFGHDVSERTPFVAAIKASNSAMGVNGDLYYIWGESTTVWGKEENNVTLMLDSHNDRVWRLEIIVELLHCPPGFTIANKTHENENNSKLQCICANDYDGVLICDNKNFRAKLMKGNWMGQIQGSNQYLSLSCPPGFCTSNLTSSHFFLPNNSESLSDLICGSKNRRGILCGQCIDRYEPAVNSPTYECVACTNVNMVANIFKYIAAVYVPIIIIFVVIIVFGIRLTSAPANAFILYSQVISSTLNLDADGQIPLELIIGGVYKTILLKAYQFLYGIFNLEFLGVLIPPFCIGAGLDTLTVISLRYTVACIPLLMILMAIVVVKIGGCVRDKCNIMNTNANTSNTAVQRQMFKTLIAFIIKRKRKLSESLLPSFAAFLLLSYTKFSLTSAYIMHKQYLIDENGTSIPPARVYYSGHLDVNDKGYIIPYLIPALLIFFIFVLVPPLLLLHYPIIVLEWCLEKIQCVWCLYPATKVHIFLDTFQGCFKIKHRYFAGLYFVFRLVINTSVILTAGSWLQRYIVQQIACIVMVILLTLCQPYNKENSIFNYIDTLMFANLAIINAISLYLYAYSQINPQINYLPPLPLCFSTYLSTYHSSGYVFWKKTKSYHKTWRMHIKVKIRNILGYCNINRYEVLEDSENADQEANAIFQRAEVQNTYQPKREMEVLSTMMIKKQKIVK